MGTRSSPGAGSRHPFSAFKHICQYWFATFWLEDALKHGISRTFLLFFFFLATNPICNYRYQVILKSSEASSRIREWTIVSDFRTHLICTAKTNVKFTHCSHHLHPSCFLYLQGFREWLRPSPCQSTKCLHTHAHPALSFRWHPCLKVLQDKQF